MPRRRKTNPTSDNLPFDLDLAIKRSLKLMNRVINELQEEGKIPSKPQVHKAQRT